MTSQHRFLPDAWKGAAAVAVLLAAAAAPGASAASLKLRAAGDAFRSLAALPELRPPADLDLLVIQHQGTIDPDWRLGIEALGGTVLGYVPDDAYLVRIHPGSEASLRSLAGTARVVPFVPSLRLSPELLRGDASTVRAWGVLGADPQAFAARAAAADPGAVLLSVHRSGAGRGSVLLDVRAASRRTLLALLASDPDVEWVEPARALSPQNADAAWVLQTGNGTPLPDRRLFSQSVCLTGAGQVVALADTGVDHDACAFRYGGSTSDVTDFNATPAPAPFVTNSTNKIISYYLVDGADAYDTATLWNYHGTKVAGSIAGDHYQTRATLTCAGGGFVPEPGDGMAPGAQLVVQDMFAADGSFAQGLNLSSLLIQAYASGARVHNMSHGTAPCDFAGNRVPAPYDGVSVDVDETLWRYRDLTSVWAAGNFGDKSPCDNGPWDGAMTLGGLGAVAKDTVTVGATLNPGESAASGEQETLALESSRGPTAEGLLKPDVVAPGHNLTPTDDGAATPCSGTTVRPADFGTSYAAGAVSGMSALVRQYFTDGYYSPVKSPGGPAGLRTRTDLTQPLVFNPSNALVKAVLINSARGLQGPNRGDLNTQVCSGPLAGCSAPSYGQGWGRVTADDTLFFPGDTRKLRVLHDIWNGSGPFENDNRGDDPGLKGALHHRETHSYAIELAAATQSLRCTLAWSDPPPSPAVSEPLVNDLDFEIHGAGPDNLWDNNDDEYLHGNAFYPDRPFNNPADPSFDRKNAVENVWIEITRPGIYNLRVHGRNVPGNGMTGVPAEPPTVSPGPTRIDSMLQGYALLCSGDAMSIKAPPAVSLTAVPEPARDPPVTCVEDSWSWKLTAACTAAPGCTPCASYAWDFGDGSPLRFTAVNTTSYVYTPAALYLASVTVRDSCGVEGRATYPVEAIVGDKRNPPGAVGNTLKVVKQAAGAVRTAFVTWSDIGVPLATSYNLYQFGAKADVGAPPPVSPPGTAVKTGVLHGALGVTWCADVTSCGANPSFTQARAANCLGQPGP